MPTRSPPIPHRTTLLIVGAAVIGLALVGAASPQEDASPTHIDDELLEAPSAHVSAIVTFQEAPSHEVLDAIEAHGSLHHAYTIIPAVHVTLPSDEVHDVAAIEGVTRVDKDEPLELHLDRSRPTAGVTTTLWNEGYTGSGTTVAIVDTGIDGTHPAMEDRIERSVTFTGTGTGPAESNTATDGDGHGTHVAAIVGGDGSNSKTLNPDDTAYTGVAPNVGLVSLDISQSFTTSTAIQAFEWVHNNHEAYDISVVQNSWGREDTGQPYDPDDPAVQASNALVADSDVAVVFSAGNSGPDPQTLSMEAMNPNVLTIGATDNQGEPTDFSSRGPVTYANGTQAAWTKPDLVAPGAQITSAASSQAASDTSLYTTMSGTSQAAPHAAGVAAMVRAENTNLTAYQTHVLLTDTARDLDPQPSPVTGHGMLDAGRALEVALDAEGMIATNTSTFTDTGTLAVGTQAEDLLPDDEGASTQTASGAFPVGQDASNVRFTFTWASTEEDLPPPDLEISLASPTGERIEVPAEDQEAHESLQDPSSGEWRWNAEPTSATEAGVATYDANATVAYPDRGPFDPASGAQGGFFDEGLVSQAERAYQQAADEFGTVPVLAAAALVGFLILVSIVRRVLS